MCIQPPHHTAERASLATWLPIESSGDRVATGVALIATLARPIGPPGLGAEVSIEPTP